ncbi:uncharacterized protein LOC109544796 [Dendroctonus ponderosae]|uniref:uncharacterized protein LOC109544796 n=1 Tax=Dendroctonus ponderosae TaxID=77166 RepID=UPI0020359808|nr:uncharacterized protein LOC109544796 [Dendroctonus ponderosae]
MRFTLCLLIALLLAVVDKSAGLKCYTCSATENDSDTSCDDDLDSLGKTGITDCDKKFCTIVRLDYIDPKGKLASLSRNCVDKVPADGITEDSTYRTYQRSCKTDLCNSGSGKSDSNSGTSDLGDKSTIYAPGTGISAANSIVAGALSAICVILVLLN